MRFLAAVLGVTIMSCGGYDPYREKFPEEKTDTVKPTKTVTYSGYVQKAFNLNVNGASFGDSEQFYTNFIDQLIKPTYGDLKNAEVVVEGQYGMDEFGSASYVFMAPTVNEGDLFEAVTDQHSKFTVTVVPGALGELYKARVIIRIGLLVTIDRVADHYCYVLYGLRDGIRLADQAKPVVFDSFKTQLNTYRCDKVESSQLVIPVLIPPVVAPVATPTGTIDVSN
jgi:hypothetical protein